MIPSWLPQNIQKRVFKYILSRLQVFSNLDTDNLDVSIGATQTQLSLKDVQLDTEKISTFPGISIRHGKIDMLNLKLAVLGNVRIEGNGLSLTISLTNEVLNDKDEFNSLLEKTTTDLASSILIPESNSGNSNTITKNELVNSINSFFEGSESLLEESLMSFNEGDTGGYGVGDFSGVINRVVDSALSQLNIVLRDITIRIVLEDATVDLLLGSFKMSTNDLGKRQVSVSDIECIMVSAANTTNSKPVPSFNSSESFNNNDMFSSIYKSDENDDLMLTQSRLFSPSDSKSLYMSAISTIPAMASTTQQETKPRIFWCENFVFSFTSLDFSSSDIHCKQINVSLKDMPPVLMSVATFLSSQNRTSPHEFNDGGKTTSNTCSNSTAQEKNFGISRLYIERLEINATSSLLPHGLFETDTGTCLIGEDIDIHTEDSSDVFFDIQSILLTKSEQMLLQFKNIDSSGKRQDMCDFSSVISIDEYGKREINFSLPFKCDINLSLNDILSFNDLIQTFQSIFSSTLQQSASNNTENKGKQIDLVGDVNFIEINISTDSHLLQTSIYPISFGHGSVVKSSKALMKLNNTKLIEVENLACWYSDNNPITARIDLIKANIDYQKLDALKEDILYHQNSSYHDKPAEILHPKTDKRLRFNQRLLHKITHSLRIRHIELNLVHPATTNPFLLDFKDLVFHATEAKTKVLSIQSLQISRDMSDVDENLGKQDLVHTIKSIPKVSCVVFVLLYIFRIFV